MKLKNKNHSGACMCDIIKTVIIYNTYVTEIEFNTRQQKVFYK